MQKPKEDLKKLLLSIDGKSYPAYKDARGLWDFGDYVLGIDHVQGDPFASPSKLSVRVPSKVAGIPKEYYQAHRRIALEDMLLRYFSARLSKEGRTEGGSGKSGMMFVSRPSQQILERSAVRVLPTGDVTVRFEAGFPANGRRITSHRLIKMLFDILPEIVNDSLLHENYDKRRMKAQLLLSDDQVYLRKYLKENDYAAFVADGSILPRKSGAVDVPMKEAYPFRSPDELAVEIELPRKGKIRGMGIKNGVTLIIGGGYHGKSTLLKALESGVYNHILGDGREYVASDRTAVKVRAEDGRAICHTDISMFIRDLPNGKDTVLFDTEDASGSTSQAANTIEAIEAGTKLLLIDEDTCATNFMVRDAIMRKVVSQGKEPIRPFISRVRMLYEKFGISTILVAGSSGAFFDVSDRVIQMEQYEPLDVTGEAGKVAENEIKEESRDSYEEIDLPSFDRVILQDRALLSDKRIKSKVITVDSFSISKETVDLRGLEQITDREQTAFLCAALKYSYLHLVNGRKTLREIADELYTILEKEGLEKLFDGGTVSGGFAMAPKALFMGTMNRYRRLSVK